MSPPRREVRGEIVPLALLLLLVVVTVRPTVHADRGIPYYLQAKTFAEFQLEIRVPDEVTGLPIDMARKDGRHYAQYPPGTSLLLVPFYWLGSTVDTLTDGRLGERRAGGWRIRTAPYVAVHLASVVFLAGILVLLRRLARVFGVSSRTYLFAAGLLVLATPFWHEAGHPRTHIPSTMWVLGSLVWAFEARNEGATKLVAAGVFAGGALLVRPTNAAFLGILGLYVLFGFPRPVRSVLSFAAPAVLGLAVLLWMNVAMWGSPFASGYYYGVQWGREGRVPVHTDLGAGFSMPVAQGLVGLTVGAMAPEEPDGPVRYPVALPGPDVSWERVRGLLLVLPVIVFAAPGFRRFWKEGKRAEVLVLAGGLGLLALIYAKWAFWFGYFHTPLAPRYLAEAYPGWCLAIAACAEASRGTVATLLRLAVFWSVSNQALVVASIYSKALAGVDPLALGTHEVAGILFATALVAEGLFRGLRRRVRPRAG